MDVLQSSQMSIAMYASKNHFIGAVITIFDNLPSKFAKNKTICSDNILISAFGFTVVETSTF